MCPLHSEQLNNLFPESVQLWKNIAKFDQNWPGSGIFKALYNAPLRCLKRI